MAKVIILLGFLGLTAVLFTFKGKQSLPLSNERFDLSKAEKVHHEKLEVMGLIKHDKDKKEQVDPEVALLEAGKKLYQASNCMQCHGENGGGNPAEEAPVIAGQHDWYISLQLNNFKSGERVNEKMMPFIEKLTGDDFKALAKYVSSLKWVRN